MGRKGETPCGIGFDRTRGMLFASRVRACFARAPCSARLAVGEVSKWRLSVPNSALSSPYPHAWQREVHLLSRRDTASTFLGKNVDGSIGVRTRSNARKPFGRKRSAVGCGHPRDCQGSSALTYAEVTDDTRDLPKCETAYFHAPSRCCLEFPVCKVMPTWLLHLLVL